MSRSIQLRHTSVLKFSLQTIPSPRLQNRLDDYIAKGTENVWVLDPGSRRGWAVSREGRFEALAGVLRTRDGKIDLPIADLFPEDPK